MLTQKESSPIPGDLVAATHNLVLLKDYLKDRKGLELFRAYGLAGLNPVSIEKDAVLMYLGYDLIDLSSISKLTYLGINSDAEFVFKFLYGDRILYSLPVPTTQKPETWLFSNTRTVVWAV